jgi:hypothetical protein
MDKDEIDYHREYLELVEAAQSLCCKRLSIESALLAANMTGTIQRLRDLAKLVGMEDESINIGLKE